MGALIREAKSQDAPAIAQLGFKVFSDTFGYSVPPADLQSYLTECYTTSAILADLTNHNKDTIIVCPRDRPDHILGFAILTRGTSEPCIRHLSGPTIELQRLYVEPDSHGQGLGKLLVTQVEAIARQQGFKAIWLGVWEENVKAQRVYERLGYERVGEHDFLTGSCRQTDWIMIKQL